MCLDGRSRRGIKALAVSGNLLFLYAMKMASTPPSTVRTPCLLFSTITPKHWTLPCLVPLNIAENSLLLDAHHRIPLARRPDCFGRGYAASGGTEIETHPGSNSVRDLALPTVVGHIPYGGACVVRKSMSI